MGVRPWRMTLLSHFMIRYRFIVSYHLVALYTLVAFPYIQMTSSNITDHIVVPVARSYPLFCMLVFHTCQLVAISSRVISTISMGSGV